MVKKIKKFSVLGPFKKICYEKKACSYVNQKRFFKEKRNLVYRSLLNITLNVLSLNFEQTVFQVMAKLKTVNHALM